MPGARDLLARLLADEEPIETRVLVIAAHPGDEVIGIGGQLPRLRNAAVLHVTDGAPRDGRDAERAGFARIEDYAAARRQEVERALALAGIDASQTACLGIPDQEAAHELLRITEAVTATIREMRPIVVVTHAYEGGHPDHDAVAFAVQKARRILREAGEAAPAVAEMTGYHAGEDGVETGSFLPHEEVQPVVVPLSAAARALKARMIGCFETQRHVLSHFPVGGSECLRVAPRYDFTEPPHAGTLFYERHRWGMTGEAFRRNVRAALDRLFLQPAA